MTTTETQPAATASEFGKIYLEYRSVFIQRACRYVRDEHIASDIVADSFMAFWENRFALPADTNVPAYVYATVRNRCLNHLRNQSLRLRIEQKMHSDQCRLVDADIASLTACDPDKLFEDEISCAIRCPNFRSARVRFTCAAAWTTAATRKSPANWASRFRWSTRK